MPTTVLAESNFLIPNGTFIAELVVFLLILAVIYRFIVPPLQRAMRQRSDLIRTQFEEAHRARERAEAAEAAYVASMNEARAEGARIRDEARAQGQQVIDEMRTRAQQEADALTQRGREELTADRDRMAGGLRAEMGTLAVELASRIVGAPLADEVSRSGGVERFLQARTEGSASAGRDGRERVGEVEPTR